MADLTLPLIWGTLALFVFNALRAVWTMVRLVRLPAPADGAPDPSGPLTGRFLRSFLYAIAAFIALMTVVFIGCDLDTLSCSQGVGSDRPFRFNFQN